MAATVAYSGITNIYDGQKRIRGVTVTISGTADGTEVLTANSCGLSTIDAVIGGVFSGTVSNETSKAILGRVVGSGATTAPISLYVGSGSTNVTQGFSLTATVTNLVVAGNLVVVGQ